MWRAHLHAYKETKHDDRLLFKPQIKKYSLPDMDEDILINAYDNLDLLGYSLANDFQLIRPLPCISLLAANLVDYKDKTILELGCHQGNTTRVYSECFKKVIAVERDVVNYEKTKENCSDVDNVEFIHADVYDDNFKIPNVDVVHIDAGHTYEEVVYDINRFVNALDKPTFIVLTTVLPVS